VHEPLFLTLEPDGSDVWRLEPVIQILKDGGVGIIPTDSLPAVVCDLSNRNAALKLYNIMELAPKKMLSILVTSLSDISRYTTGFPVPTQPGQPDLFRVAQRLLPGPYTFILPASKNLPRQVIDFKTGKTKQRNSVGVRMPKDPIVQAVMEGLGECLLSHSVHVDDQLDSETECPDTGTLLDMYGNRGLDFIVDTGKRVVTATSIVDLTRGEPEVVRVGQGDVSMFQE
jgi:tRNA threonylcarbamoyl adenosine modification protein (Sua5/YciO/YrdC/YwlC family)